MKSLSSQCQLLSSSLFSWCLLSSIPVGTK